MKHLIWILAILASNIALADDWLCTSESSQKRDSTILACGIGRAPDENGARSQAFENAKKEFDRICMTSDDCRGHRINVTPNRTACDQSNGSVVCRRLISFEIGEADSNTSVRDPIPIENFKPFSSAQLSAFPRVKKGMTLDQVMQIWGRPMQVEGGPSMKTVTYHGAMCQFDFDRCQLYLENGRLYGTNHIGLEYDGIAVE